MRRTRAGLAGEPCSTWPARATPYRSSQRLALRRQRPLRGRRQAQIRAERSVCGQALLAVAVESSFGDEEGLTCQGSGRSAQLAHRGLSSSGTAPPTCVLSFRCHRAVVRRRARNCPQGASRDLLATRAQSSTASWCSCARVVRCPRSNANLRQEETVSDSDRSGVLFRRRDDAPRAVSWLAAATVSCPVAARALRREGGAPTVAEPAAWRCWLVRERGVASRLRRGVAAGP